MAGKIIGGVFVVPFRVGISDEGITISDSDDLMRYLGQTESKFFSLAVDTDDAPVLIDDGNISISITGDLHGDFTDTADLY